MDIFWNHTFQYGFQRDLVGLLNQSKTIILILLSMNQSKDHHTLNYHMNSETVLKV